MGMSLISTVNWRDRNRRTASCRDSSSWSTPGLHHDREGKTTFDHLILGHEVAWASEPILVISTTTCGICKALDPIRCNRGALAVGTWIREISYQKRTTVSMTFASVRERKSSVGIVIFCFSKM